MKTPVLDTFDRAWNKEEKMELEKNALVAQKGPKLENPVRVASALLANVINVPFSLGEALPPLFAIGLTDWVEYQAAISSVILGGATHTLSIINLIH